MGYGSHGSWVSSLMGQMGHGLQDVISCQLSVGSVSNSQRRPSLLVLLTATLVADLGYTLWFIKKWQYIC